MLVVPAGSEWVQRVSPPSGDIKTLVGRLGKRCRGDLYGARLLATDGAIVLVEFGKYYYLTLAKSAQNVVWSIQRHDFENVSAQCHDLGWGRSASDVIARLKSLLNVTAQRLELPVPKPLATAAPAITAPPTQEPAPPSRRPEELLDEVNMALAAVAAETQR